MRSIFSVCLVFCCLVSSADAITHYGATDPATEGWTNTKAPPGYAGTDCWITDTLGYSQWQPTVTPTAADFSGNWFLIVDARWVDGPVGESRTTIFDGVNYKSTALTWDEMAAYYYQAGFGDTAFPGVDPTVRHTYRIDYNAVAELMTFSVDNAPLIQLESYEQNDTAGQYMLYWGDNLGAAVHSQMEWYGVGFNAIPEPIVPEPATWILLLTTAVCSLIVYGWRRYR